MMMKTKQSSLRLLFSWTLLRRLLFFLLCLFLVADVYGWAEHTLGTYPALKNMPRIKNAPDVKVESLKAFLDAEGAGLAQLLADEEKWAIENVDPYPPRPAELAYKNGEPQGRLDRFLIALRINPSVPMLDYLQLLPGHDSGGRQALTYRQVSVYKKTDSLASILFFKLKEGEMVRPLDVIAMGSDEPDYGHDIGLWSDNKTVVGKKYAFGDQPFGNPKFEYASQAPFHMGFYHESWIIFAAAGFLKRTLPVYRIHQFQTLSRYAFKTGHDYWGYRFAGWALHYLQDLTQPYHSSVLPSRSTMGMLWINTIHMIGFSESRNIAIQRVSNRHTAIERFQRTLMLLAREKGDFINPAVLATANMKNDAIYGAWSNDYIIEIVAEESNERADDLDDAIVDWMPEHIVVSPEYTFSSDVREVFREIKKANPQAVTELTKAITPLFASFGIHTRNFVVNTVPERNKK